MIRDGKPANFSGEGNTAGNWIMYGVVLLLFIVGLYMLNFLSFGTVWIPMGGLILLGSLAFAIPKEVIGRSNTVDEGFVTDPIHETKSPNL